jgi:hypothetical protein
MTKAGKKFSFCCNEKYEILLCTEGQVRSFMSREAKHIIRGLLPFRDSGVAQMSQTSCHKSPASGNRYGRLVLGFLFGLSAA